MNVLQSPQHFYPADVTATFDGETTDDSSEKLLSAVLHGFARFPSTCNNPRIPGDCLEDPQGQSCARPPSCSPFPPLKRPIVNVTFSDGLIDSTDGCPEEPLSLGVFHGSGYHPSVQVGNRLGINGRYQIVSKLGWGEGATVWLAVDTQKEAKTFVSIRILTYTLTDLNKRDLNRELPALQKISAANPGHPGFKHNLALLDYFIISHSDWDHLCLVTDVLGSNLSTLRPPGRDAFTVPVAKRIVKQVLLALSYLHDECGYVHIDVKPQNLLVKLPPASDAQIEAYIQANPSLAYDRELVHEPDLPPDAVFTKSQPLPNFGLDPSFGNISVCLIDYEEVLPFVGKIMDMEFQPPIIRAPELMLRHSLHTPADVWTIGCLLFELVTNVPLFGLCGTFTEDSKLQIMAELFGPFSQKFLASCKHRSEFFDEQGSLSRTEEMKPTTLEDVLRRLNVDEEEVSGTATFIRRCMVLDPNLRPSPRELLQDAWLEDSVVH